MTGRVLNPVKPAEPWRQRLIRSLLYGRNVDRSAKARARVGFAMLAFVAIYGVIGGRLIMFAVGGDSHGGRRAAAQDGIATARPDIVDRNGEVLSTDVKAPRLVADLRVERALRDELLKAKEKFHAKAASGLVSNVRTGEIVAMVSVPDFDPNNPKEAHDPDRINRLTTGVYEMGSTFKAFTLAMALDTGKYDLNSMWDARGPLHYGKFTIHDDHPLGRMINMREVFTFSSNVGAARIALSQGVEAHKAFLRKMGQLERLRTELPESASPIVPKRWAELNTVTIAFGHGLSVAPLQAVMGIDALVNGGYLIPPTFLKRTEQEAMAVAKRVIKPETSDKMRFLMRLNAEIGTAKKADVKGYYIGGKTGTAEKVINGHYAKKRVLNAFTAILPADNPRYQLLIMLDEPQPLKETFGFITSGWNAVPTGGNVIARIAPLLGIEPRFDLPPSDRLILAASKTTQ